MLLVLVRQLHEMGVRRHLFTSCSGGDGDASAAAASVVAPPTLLLLLLLNVIRAHEAVAAVASRHRSHISSDA